jgi:gas vesicle protein
MLSPRQSRNHLRWFVASNDELHIFELREFVFPENGCYHPDSQAFARRQSMSDRDGSGFLWFLAGVGIGAAVGILYAPKAGDEIRQQLREVAEDGRDTVKERARQAREQAGSWADKGRDYLSQQKDQIRTAYEAGRQAYREATSESVEGSTPNVP